MLYIKLAEDKDLGFIKDSYRLLDRLMTDLLKKQMHADENEQGNDEEYGHTDKYWRDLIGQKDGYILIAFQEDTPAGMAVVIRKNEQEAHLEDLIVWPDFRKQGIGEALVKEAKAFAIQKGCKYMSLNVLPNNEDAIHIYKKESFKERKISMLCRL